MVDYRARSYKKKSLAKRKYRIPEPKSIPVCKTSYADRHPIKKIQVPRSNSSIHKKGIKSVFRRASEVKITKKPEERKYSNWGISGNIKKFGEFKTGGARIGDNRFEHFERINVKKEPEISTKSNYSTKRKFSIFDFIYQKR